MNKPLKSYNVKSIAANLELVFKSGDIEKLNKPAYHFLTMQCGFIAHYDLYGFRATYRDLRELAANIQTGEGNIHHDNASWASRYERNPWFAEQYGLPYAQSIADGLRAVCKVAAKWQPTVERVFAAKEKEHDLAVARALLAKHGIDG